MSDSNQLSREFLFYASDHKLILDELEDKLYLDSQFAARGELAECMSKLLDKEFSAPSHIEEKLTIYDKALKTVLDPDAGPTPVNTGSSSCHPLKGKFEKYQMAAFLLTPRHYQFEEQISSIKSLFFMFVILFHKNDANRNIAKKLRRALDANLLPIKTIQLVNPKIKFSDLAPLILSLQKVKDNNTEPREAAFAQTLFEIVNAIVSAKPVVNFINESQINKTTLGFEQIDKSDSKSTAKPQELCAKLLEENSKEWITRNQKVTPNDYRIFENSELRGLVDSLVANLTCSDNKVRDASAIVLLSLFIGQNVDTVKKLEFGDEGSLTLTGEYCREIKIPMGAFVPKNKSTDLRPRAKFIKLPLPPILKHWLSSLPNSNKALIDCIGTPHDDLDKSIENVLKRIKSKPGLFRIRQEKISAALHLALTLLYRDESINYIITRRENHKAPDSSYYISHEVSFIQRAYASALEKMLSGTRIEEEYKQHIEKFTFADNSFVTSYYPSPEAISSFRKKALAKLDSAKQKKDIIEIHNSYVDYCLALLMIGTGHRPVEDPFPKQSHIDGSSNLLIISDKVTFRRSNWRFAGISNTAIKQLELYQSYLGVLPPKLAELSQEVSEQVAKYVGGDEDVIPQFFYLERKSHLRIVSVTKARMTNRWQSMWEFPPNYTRHITATELMKLSCSGELVKAQLGHNYDGSDRFGKTSTLAPKNFFTATSKYLEQILKENGWSAIKSPIRKTSPYSIKGDGKYHKPYNFAYKRREAKRKLKRQNRIEKARLSIQEHLVIVLGKTDLKTITDSEHEDLALAIDKESNPNRKPQINALKYLIDTKTIVVIKEEQDHAKWTNNIEASFLREDSIRKYQIAQTARQNFLNHINTQKKINHCDPNIRLAEITISAAIFGGVHNAMLLENLFGSMKLVLNKHDDAILIDFSNYGMTMRQRRIWFLDPISTGLVLGLYKNKSMNVNKVDEKKYATHLSALLQKIKAQKISKQDNCFEFLEQIGRNLALFELPGFLGGFTSGRLQTVSLPLDSIVRADSRMALDIAHIDLEDASAKQGYFLPPFTNKGGSQGAVKFKQQFSKHKHTILIKPNEKNDTYNNRCKKELYELLKSDFQTNDYWNDDSKVIGGFVMFLCKEGTIRKRNPAYSTVLNYSDAITRFFIKCLNNTDFENKHPSEVDWQVLFESAIKHTFRWQAKSMTNVIRQFHRFLRLKHSIKNIDWTRIGNSDLETDESSNIDANFVSEFEYLTLIDMLLQNNELNEVERLQTALIAFCGYRFGLRIAEAHRLLNRDIINGESLALVITQNYMKSNKTIASRRIVSIDNSELTEIEKGLFERYLSIQRRNMMSNGSSPFFRDADDPESAISKDNASALLNTYLKEITGDDSIRFHHLRHSKTTKSVSKTLFPINYDLLSIDRPTFNTHFYNLREIAVSMGHAHDTTTLKTYTHCLDRLVLDWLPDFEHKLNDWGNAYILSMRHDSVRTKRLREKNSKDHTTSILSPRKNKTQLNLLPSHDIKLKPFVANLSSTRDENGASIKTLLDLSAIVFDYASTSDSISDYLVLQRMQKSKIAIIVTSLCEIEQESGFALFQFNSRMRERGGNNKIELWPSELKGSQSALENFYIGNFVKNRHKNNLDDDLRSWSRTFHAPSHSHLLEDYQQYNRLMMLFMNFFDSPAMNLNFNSTKCTFSTETSSTAIVKIGYKNIPKFRDQGAALINKTAQLKVKKVRKRNISSIVIFIVCSYIRILEKDFAKKHQ